MNDAKSSPLIGRGARNPWGPADSPRFAYPVVTEVRRAGAAVRSSAPAPSQPTFRTGSGPTDAPAPA